MLSNSTFSSLHFTPLLAFAILFTINSPHPITTIAGVGGHGNPLSIYVLGLYNIHKTRQKFDTRTFTSPPPPPLPLEDEDFLFRFNSKPETRLVQLCYSLLQASRPDVVHVPFKSEFTATQLGQKHDEENGENVSGSLKAPVGAKARIVSFAFQKAIEMGLDTTIVLADSNQIAKPFLLICFLNMIFWKLSNLWN